MNEFIIENIIVIIYRDFIKHFQQEGNLFLQAGKTIWSVNNYV